MSEEKICFVGKAPCGCYRYAVADEITASDLQDIGRMIRQGWTIETKPLSFVHNGGLNFKCTHKPIVPRSGGPGTRGAKVGA